MECILFLFWGFFKIMITLNIPLWTILWDHFFQSIWSIPKMFLLI